MSEKNEKIGKIVKIVAEFIVSIITALLASSFIRFST